MEETIHKLITTKKMVPIDSIVPNPWNPNVETATVYNAIKKTIQEKGLIGTITTRQYLGHNQIINGEHRYRICKELGWVNLPIEDMGEISDADAYFWTLKLNEGGKNEVEKLAKLYAEIPDEQLSLLGTTKEEIDNTKNLFKFDFAQYATNDPGIAPDVMAHILSFHFNEEEWKAVQKAIQIVKQSKETEKQWFMDMLKNFLQINLGSSPGETEVTF